MKENEKPNTDEEIVKEFFYFDDAMRDYDFSDFVRISASPRGIIFSFGKFCPDEKKFGIFKEILLPFDVAEALSNIIKEHLDKLVEMRLIQRNPAALPTQETRKK